MLYLFPTLCFVAWAVLHFVAPYIILQPVRVDREPLPSSKPGFISQAVESSEGFRLDGYQYQVDSARAVIIMLHGIGSSKEVYDELSIQLGQLGIASFAFDNRGQGKSEGKFVTFGSYEKYDLQKIVTLAEAQYPGIPIGIWGNSLGAAVALQTLTIENRLSFAVIESTFARLDQIVLAYQKRITGGIGSKVLTDYALRRAGELADFDPDQVQPAEAAKSIEVPVFLAHGDADIHINVANGRKIFENLAGHNNQLMIVEGADHSGLYSAGGPAYPNAIWAFLEKVID